MLEELVNDKLNEYIQENTRLKEEVNDLKDENLKIRAEMDKINDEYKELQDLYQDLINETILDKSFEDYDPSKNYVSMLNEKLQRTKQSIPSINRIKVGQDHTPQFQYNTIINGTKYESEFYPTAKMAQNNLVYKIIKLF